MQTQWMVSNRAPTVNDDTTQGYSGGLTPSPAVSVWFDVTHQLAYWCSSAATGAAVWNSFGSGTGGGVPYTGATQNLNMGVYSVLAGVLTGTNALLTGQPDAISGSQLLPTTSLGWTATGWTPNYGTLTFANTTNNTAALTNTLAAQLQVRYSLAVTITGRTAGSITLGFGGETYPNLTISHTWQPLATSTGTFSVTPTSTFNGTITLALYTLTDGAATLKMTQPATMTTKSLGNVEFVDDGQNGHLYFTMSVSGAIKRVQLI